MKQKLIILMMALLVTGGIDLQAQVKTEGKIKVEITKEVNGEKKTFKGEYNSTEEMKADPNYQEFAGTDEQFDFWMDGDFDEDKMSLHLDHLKGLSKSFKFLDDEDGNLFLRHFGDKEDDGSFFFRHFDGDSSERFLDLHFDDLDMDEYNEKIKELGLDLEVLFDKLHDDDPSHRVKILVYKNVKISDVSGDEFGKKGKVAESSKLVLDDLTFSPNPSSNGRFKVRFKVAEEKELNIRVYNLDGKEVFNRYFERFGGTYSETIDLSGQSEGIYLLEITQDGKRLTKKIAIN